MPLPNKPFSEWGPEDLNALIIEPQAIESARLDFKTDCKVCSGIADEKEKARLDILKDVAAMANGVGGTLLIGVRQTGKKNCPSFAEKIEGINETDVQRLKQTIEELVTTHLDIRPAPLVYDFISHKDGLVVLAISIPTNTYCLSMVTYDEINQFWVRRGTDNRPMRTDEIEFKLSQFAKVRDSASVELKMIRRRLAVQYNKKPFAWFAAVPLNRQRDHIPVKVNEIRNLIKKSSSYNVAYPERAQAPGKMMSSIPQDITPSLRGLSIKPDSQPQCTLDIQRDGTTVFAMNAPYNVSTYTTQIGSISCHTLEFWSVYETWLNGLHLFLDLQDKYNFGKAAIVQAGLLCARDLALMPNSSGLNTIHDAELPFDPITIDDNWKPSDVFWQWAKQLGNAAQSEDPFPYSPWVTSEMIAADKS